MYPCYPLLAFMGAASLDEIGNIIQSSTDFFFVNSSAAASDNKKSTRFSSLLRNLSIIVCLTITIILGISRIASNVNNFGGYLSLWTQISKTIPKSDALNNSNNGQYFVVCTGGEWYQFPSHFFLPQNARVEFVNDTFHAQLPQHFSSIHGTFCEPLQPFNDRNLEEPLRYVSLSACDYVVAVVDTTIDYEHDEDVATRMPLVSRLLKSEAPLFTKMFDKKVLNPKHSPSALARAFFIPALSNKKNTFNLYSFFERLK